MVKLMTVTACLLCIFGLCQAEEKAPLTGKKAKDSYSLGYDFGRNLKSQEVDLDEEILVGALRDALRGKEPEMKTDAMREELKQLRKEVLIRYNIRLTEFAAKNRKDGEAFLAANKTKTGITTLKSGLQYKVLAEGNGPVPKASDLVTVNYRGTFLNGREFDNTYAGGHPELVRVDGMIPAWQEALPLMKTGSKWQLFVPADLAYGERPSAKIPPNSTLVYDLELVSIEKAP